MRQLLVILLGALVTVNAQWMIHNQTVVNTTYYAHPIPQNPPPNFVRNNAGYYPPAPGFIQQNVPTYIRNATGYNNTAGNSGNLMVGTPGPSDVVLFKEYYIKASRWLQIREKNVEFPMYPTTAKYRITAVHAIDMSKTPGGHANILTGGVGFSYVTIRLFSERSRGFSYKVIIYGH